MTVIREPKTPQEVAAVIAVFAVLEAESAVGGNAPAEQPQHASAWVEASRRAAQRAALQRGSWRLSGRIGRRSRI